MWGKKIVQPQLIDVLLPHHHITALSMSDELNCILCGSIHQNIDTAPVLMINGNNSHKFIGSATNKTRFNQLNTIGTLHIQNVVCSNNRIILLCTDGRIYLLGQSLIDDTFSTRPLLIQLPDNVMVQQVCIDSDILLVLTHDGAVLQYRNKRFMRVHFTLSNSIRERTTKWTSNVVDIHQSIYMDGNSYVARNQSIDIRKISMCAAANRGLAVSYDGKLFDFKLNVFVANDQYVTTASTSPTIKSYNKQSSASPPTQSISMTHKQRNTRIEARLIESDQFFVDVSVRRGQSCGITDTGYIYTFGLDCIGMNNNSTGISLNRPTKINNLSQVTGICLGESHMLLTVSTHKHNPSTYNKRKSVSEHIPQHIDTLQLLCEKQLCITLQHKQYIYTLQFALQHQFYYLANYIATYILRNIPILLNHATQQLTITEWYFINKCYHTWNNRQLAPNELVTLNNIIDTQAIRQITELQSQIHLVQPIKLNTQTHSPKLSTRTTSTPKSVHPIPTPVLTNHQVHTESLPVSVPVMNGSATPLIEPSNTTASTTKESKSRIHWHKLSLADINHSNDSRSLLQHQLQSNVQPTNNNNKSTGSILRSMQSNTSDKSSTPPTRSPKWSPSTSAMNTLSLLQIQQQQSSTIHNTTPTTAHSINNRSTTHNTPSRNQSISSITSIDSLPKPVLSSYLPATTTTTTTSTATATTPSQSPPSFGKKWNTAGTSPMTRKLSDIQSYESMNIQPGKPSRVAWASFHSSHNYIQPCKLVDVLSEQYVQNVNEIERQQYDDVIQSINEKTSKTVNKHKHDKPSAKQPSQSQPTSSATPPHSCSSQTKPAHNKSQIWAVKNKKTVTAV